MLAVSELRLFMTLVFIGRFFCLLLSAFHSGSASCGNTTKNDLDRNFTVYSVMIQPVGIRMEVTGRNNEI